MGPDAPQQPQEGEQQEVAQQPRPQPQPEEGVFAVLVAVVLATFGSLISYATVCAEQHACLAAGTCYPLSGAHASLLGSCSFKNSITPAGWRLLNGSAQTSSLQRMNRGVCAPGMRQNVDSSSGDVECVRKRSYPNALLDEIGDATGASDHRRWCGGWIDAGSSSSGVDLKWAFFDQAAVEADVEVLAKGSGRLGMNDVSKFRTACRSMVTSNSEAAAGKLAFDYLDAQLPPVATLDDALRAVGVLSSHFCDAPATLGLTYDGEGFLVNLTAGAQLSAETLRSALYGVGEDHSTRQHAAEYAATMQAIDGMEPIVGTMAQAIVRGSHEGTWLNGYVGPQMQILFDVENPTLARFVMAFAQHHHSSASVAVVRARAYLRGVAAYCSYAARSVVTGEFGATGAALLEATAHGIRANRPPAAALGRLRGGGGGGGGGDGVAGVEFDQFAQTADARTMLDASRVTLSSLTRGASPLIHGGDARSACLRAARVAFPDDFDKLAFDQLVTARLYDRLDALSMDLKASAEDALQDTRLVGSLFSSDANRDFTVELLRSTRLRVAGAPRGTWAGVQHDFERPSLTSTDGALLILLKQARAVFLDRMFKAAKRLSVCSHPPLYDALRRNAYLLVSSNFACAVLLPGLLVPPFADERYDDASLAARVGFVIAHEFMHVTSNTGVWDASRAGQLLQDYEPGTELEAIADVGGLVAVMRLGVVDAPTLCAHVSQLWCGRRAWTLLTTTPFAAAQQQSHPRTNDRGDAACEFLRRHFPTNASST